ncbi:MAG: hypothetical protein KKD44_06170 [Proteobacteria bacterium]|nr:hypothetical protein [Pseudomonadota bacterium]
MTKEKNMWEILLEIRPDATSNRLANPRRSWSERRRQCLLDMALERRNASDRRKESERRKRWKRVGDWGSQIDRESYLEGYRVT